MKKKRRKCVAWSKSALWCDGCKHISTKCPMRDKYRDLRDTKYGNDKYLLKPEVDDVTQGIETDR